VGFGLVGRLAEQVEIQRNPAQAFDCRTEVTASPRALVGCLAAHHRVVLMGEGRTRRRWCRVIGLYKRGGGVF
jgi:hypothetical protein